MTKRICPVSWLIGAICGMFAYALLVDVLLHRLLIVLRDMP
jgi:hypothetical protein